MVRFDEERELSSRLLLAKEIRTAERNELDLKENITERDYLMRQ